MTTVRSNATTQGSSVPALVGERLTLSAFMQLSGTLSGYSYVKLVVDRDTSTIHFIDSTDNVLHVKYIWQHILHRPMAELERTLDSFNFEVYQKPDRRFCLGILALHNRHDEHSQQDRRFFSLETVEADTMTADMLRRFYAFVREHVDLSFPLLFKPANHLQESHVAGIDATELPRVMAHELFSTAPYVPLNPGSVRGRLRVFHSAEEYRAAEPLAWHDIVVMPRVPDDIPRLAGIVNAAHTTPLSHTNILAAGWQIPNAIQLGILDRLDADRLDGTWVDYRVDPAAPEIGLEPVAAPADLDQRPPWLASRVVLEPPDVAPNAIVPLSALRTSDHYRYGTKAANLGELCDVLEHGSGRLFGFYRIPRPPRENLLGHLGNLLGVDGPGDGSQLTQAAERLLRTHVRVPRGIALPFSLHQRFLESSPRIQQAIGKLKMALELEAREIDPLCVSLQRMIMSTRLPADLRAQIDDAIVTHLAGVRTFVVRSSSNAEDLAGFSAAGIYESVNHVSTADTIFDSVKLVWASLVSTRSVRLRHEAGISLDDCYMGVIVQQQVETSMGGVLVTTNPMNSADFRNVYVNVSPQSVTEVVSGNQAPLQYLYNTVEGGGRTLSLGDAGSDVDAGAKEMLQRLALVGRLLQSHFAPDYTFATPVDIEWAADSDRIYLLQLRPYAV
jgi:hypothetical protein